MQLLWHNVLYILFRALHDLGRELASQVAEEDRLGLLHGNWPPQLVGEGGHALPDYSAGNNVLKPPQICAEKLIKIFSHIRANKLCS